MFEFKADLHIHSVLSPCGSLEMSPANIISYASKKGLDIIGITDHNTTRHCRLVAELGKEQGIFVMIGTEVNTREEIHCLAFFETFQQLDIFQSYLDMFLPRVKNDPSLFGHQVQVDRDEQIVFEEEFSLFGAIDQSIEEVRDKIHELEGLFIPAHIDRPRNSIYSQLGFYPEDLGPDAIEISWSAKKDHFLSSHPELKGIPVVRSSDAHYPEDVGRMHTKFNLQTRSFNEIKMALKKQAGREAVEK